MRVHTRHFGLTLLESMIALAIFAIVVWAAMANYTTAITSQNATQVAVEVQALRASVKELYAGQPNYGEGPDAVITSIIASNRVPRTMTVHAGTIRNSFGGMVEVEGHGAFFTLLYPDLPRSLCIRALTGTAANGWYSAELAGQVIPLPVNMPEAVAICASEGNNLIFTGI